jgi:hypothetical protein
VNGWWVFLGCLAVAVFLAWRDEHKKARSKYTQRHKAINECLDRAALRLKDPRLDITTFQALYNAGAYDLESPDEVSQVCDELVTLGHVHPFHKLGMPKEEWLEFLVTGKRHPKYDFGKGVDYLDAAQEWALDRKRSDPGEHFAVFRSVVRRI